MRFICINASNTPALGIYEGEIYDVFDEIIICEIPAYILTIFPKKPLAKDRFIPLSDIDETELVNHKEEVA